MAPVLLIPSRESYSQLASAHGALCALSSLPTSKHARARSQIQRCQFTVVYGMASGLGAQLSSLGVRVHIGSKMRKDKTHDPRLRQHRKAQVVPKRPSKISSRLALPTVARQGSHWLKGAQRQDRRRTTVTTQKEKGIKHEQPSKLLFRLAVPVAGQELVGGSVTRVERMRCP